jgi:DNA-binding protein Fis
MVDYLPAEVREPKTVVAPPEDVNAAIDAAVRPLFALARKDPKLKIMAAVERELIIRALAETGGNQVQAAKLLGVTRATLRKRIEKFGIEQRVEVR